MLFNSVFPQIMQVVGDVQLWLARRKDQSWESDPIKKPYATKLTQVNQYIQLGTPAAARASQRRCAGRRKVWSVCAAAMRCTVDAPGRAACGVGADRVDHRGNAGQCAHGNAPGTVSPVQSGFAVAAFTAARGFDCVGVLLRAGAPHFLTFCRRTEAQGLSVQEPPHARRERIRLIGKQRVAGFFDALDRALRHGLPKLFSKFC